MTLQHLELLKWSTGRDSNPHCSASETDDSYQLVYPWKVVPRAGFEPALSSLSCWRLLPVGLPGDVVQGQRIELCSPACETGTVTRLKALHGRSERIRTSAARFMRPASHLGTERWMRRLDSHQRSPAYEAGEDGCSSTPLSPVRESNSRKQV